VGPECSRRLGDGQVGDARLQALRVFGLSRWVTEDCERYQAGVAGMILLNVRQLDE